MTALVLVGSYSLASLALDPTHYWEGWTLVLVSTLGMGALVLLGGFVVPRDLFRPLHATPTLRPWKFGVLGAGYSSGEFFVAYVLPHLLPLPLIVIALELALPIGVLLYFLSVVGRRDHATHLVVFSGGLLVPLLVVASVYEVFVPPEFGIGLPAVAALYLLWRLYRRTQREAMTPRCLRPAGAPPPSLTFP